MGFFETLGLIKTRIVFWFFLIVLLIVVIGGVVEVVQNHHTEKVTATLNNVTCVPSMQNNVPNGYQCSGQQTYVVDGKTYSIPYDQNQLPAPRPNADTSTVYYNPTDPSDASTISRSGVAMIFVVISLVLLLIVAISYFRYEMSKENPYWATGEGVLTGVNVVANLIR